MSPSPPMPCMPVAQASGEIGQPGARFRRSNEEEIVAVRVRFRDSQGRHQGIVKALNTYVNPAPNPMLGSRDVTPRCTAASARQLPIV